ncbi:MAG: hypothetical protein WCQ69_03380 [Bacteroidales bacterium]
MQITDILPQYTQLNTIIAEISNRQSIEFTQQQFVVDFYIQFNNIQAFEVMLVDLTIQAELERYKTLIDSLSTEIQNNIRLISSNKNTLENLNIEKTCDKFANQYETQISNQLHIMQQHWKELSEVNNLLDAIGFRQHTEQEEKHLWEKHETLTEKYNSEKAILNDLYEKQKVARKTAEKYQENCLPKILSLSEKFTAVVEKYLPQNQTTPQSGIYFDMSIVSAIHKECNDQQFEDISELDLYAVLNLLPSSEKLTIKKGKKIGLSGYQRDRKEVDDAYSKLGNRFESVY